MNVSTGEKTFSVSRHVSALLLAVQFLTIFPVKQLPIQDKTTTGLSLLYYPLVGLLIGAILVVAAWIGQALFVVHSVQVLLLAALLLSVWVGLTGALHLDGLADCADAWVGGFGSRQKTLEIMKDPTSGPVAIAVVVLLLLVKLTALVAVLTYGSIWLLLLAPLLARLSLLVLLLSTPYVRKQGLGEILSRYFPRSAATKLCLLGVLGLLVLAFSKALALLLCVGVTLLLLRRMMMSRLGGCTGDTLGAAVEIVEVVCLVALVALL